MRTTTLVSAIAAVSLAYTFAMGSFALAESVTPSPTPPAASSVEGVQPVDTQSSIKVGDLVRSAAGGPVMKVRAINGDQAVCDPLDANARRATLPITQLIAVTDTERNQSADTESNQPSLNEPQTYHPCPAEVVTADGRHECLR